VFWAGGELSDAECRRLSLVPPAFKCAQAFVVDSNPKLLTRGLGLQAMVVQLIMGWRFELPLLFLNVEITPVFNFRGRTYNISRRSTPIFYLLTILYLAVISVWLYPDRTISAQSSLTRFPGPMVYKFLRTLMCVLALLRSLLHIMIYLVLPVSRLGVSNHNIRSLD
jgi:hypothetical protein